MCDACGGRFTTFERVQLKELVVIKRSGRRVAFDRDKLMRSIEIALRKRPVEPARIERLVTGIVRHLESTSEGEVTSEAVGERVAAALTGTFLGILGAYGFVNPVTARIKANNAIDIQYFNGISKGLSGFTGGMAPMMAVEMARRCFDPAVQPGADEMEKAIKAMPPTK